MSKNGKVVMGIPVYPKKKYNYKKRLYGTKASFMPKTLAKKRYNQVSTRTFWFKTSGTIASDQTGKVSKGWTTQFPGATPQLPYRLPIVADSTTAARMYTEYKVLAIRVRLFSANIGDESAGQGQFRGNTVTYLEQDVDWNAQLPNQVAQIINRGSARMIPSRVSKHTRVIYRPKGFPEWGNCDPNTAQQDREPDPWKGAMYVFGETATPSIPILWYYTATWKIIFRGRTTNVPGLP